MREKIQKTITSTTFTPAIVTINEGQVNLEPLMPLTCNNMRLEEAGMIKLAKKEYGNKQNYLILESSYGANTYEMDIDTFIANSVKVKEDK